MCRLFAAAEASDGELPERGTSKNGYLLTG